MADSTLNRAPLSGSCGESINMKKAFATMGKIHTPSLGVSGCSESARRFDAIGRGESAEMQNHASVADVNDHVRLQPAKT